MEHVLVNLYGILRKIVTFEEGILIKREEIYVLTWIMYRLFPTSNQVKKENEALNFQLYL